MLAEIKNLLDELRNVLADIVAKLESALQANVDSAVAQGEVKLSQESVDAVAAAAAAAVEALLSTPKQ